MSRYFCLCILLLTVCTAFAELKPPLLTVKHFQTHHRYEFGVDLLVLALSKSGKSYQLTSPLTAQVNEARGQLMVESGELDVLFVSTTHDRERAMIPVKTPVYRGLLGLRLLLVKPELSAGVSQVGTLKQLRQYVGGHGLHWGDFPVYAENQLKVVPVVEYEKIFEMLKLRRFDYFHRGITEIWGELARYSSEFVIAENLMLFYPHPVYFFVTPDRKVLAQDIEIGLQSAVEDGSYRALFDKYFREDIAKANLESRKLVRLMNPVVPQDALPIDTGWWMPAVVGSGR